MTWARAAIRQCWWILKDVKRVTDLGRVLGTAYAKFIEGMVRLGVTDEEPVEIQGQKVVPLEFAVAFILSQRGRLMKEAGITEPMRRLEIVVKGYTNGGKEIYTFSMSSRGQGMGEGTGIPAAIGNMTMVRGRLKGRVFSCPKLESILWLFLSSPRPK